MSAFDIIASILIIVLIYFAIKSVIKRKKSGGCASCPYSGECRHNVKTPK